MAFVGVARTVLVKDLVVLLIVVPLLLLTGINGVDVLVVAIATVVVAVSVAVIALAIALLVIVAAIIPGAVTSAVVAAIATAITSASVIVLVTVVVAAVIAVGGASIRELLHGVIDPGILLSDPE